MSNFLKGCLSAFRIGETRWDSAQHFMCLLNQQTKIPAEFWPVTSSYLSVLIIQCHALWRSADSPLNIADLCPAIPDMGLLYLLAYLLWLFILLRGQGRLWCSRIFVKVRLGVILVCWLWYVREWNFRDARGVYNCRPCGWSVSLSSGEFVAVRSVRVLESRWLVCKICVAKSVCV